ncbi:PREDICTED: tripartite motif-containing protein 16-like [Poecilia mexicana]|uniref:Tripartite motif-containing protein 16-like n=1 Tax=Poecilia mexicana TaxID=48701 RepID=A0A3B3WXP1_9TELE|nr:PREDICTED: tripartite motif-containing protein 16-like [Poecilia mexicana]
MAQPGLKLEQEKLSCSICLDLMKDPTTIPCGHSYCLICIGRYWDAEESPSCPQCRQSFSPRPVLVRSSVLADLVEERRRSSGPPAAPDEPSQDVLCDFCSEEKQKAVKSCLQCLVSFCEQHLQPHFSISALKKHKLVEPSQQLEDSVCPLHSEVMKIFCRTDQSCICYLCLMDEHKGHQTLSAAAEMSNKQKELAARRQDVQRRIQGRQQEVEKLQQVEKDIHQSADEALRNAEKIFTAVKQQLRSQQESEVNKVKELQETLEEEIRGLRRTAAMLEELQQTSDHIRFLQNYGSLARLGEASDPSRIDVQPESFRRDAEETVSELRDRLEELLTEEWSPVPPTGPDVEVLVPQAEPQTRGEFLQYACPLTLDLNTANMCVRCDYPLKAYSHRINGILVDHPDKFSYWPQILCSESLTGRCYWEVEWKASSNRWDVFIAVSYKDISRKGDESAFGNNKKSWALQCYNKCYEFRHNWIRTPVSGPFSSRIGVYLDHSAGVLSFYSVSNNNMSLLHRVQTTFTRPLCPGFGLYDNASAQIWDHWSDWDLFD